MKKAVTLMELIMVITIIGILAMVAIPNMKRSSMAAKEAAAQANLRIVAAALENYATVNNGQFATDESQLTGAAPKYLNQSFCSHAVGGYNFTCTLSSSSYTINAAPVSCGSSGSMSYGITTGGAMSSAACG